MSCACGSYNIVLCHFCTHTQTQKHTHRFKFFDFFGKIAKLNTRAIERNSSFLMKTSGIREILDKLSHIKLLWLLLSLGI